MTFYPDKNTPFLKKAPVADRLYFICSIAACCGMLLLSKMAQAQHHPDQVDAKARKYYEQAQRYLGLPATASDRVAVNLLRKAIAADSGFFDAYAQLGSLYNRMHQYDNALSCFTKAYQLDSAAFSSGLSLYAKAAAGTGDFARALELLNHYLQQPGLSEDERERAISSREHFRFALQSAQKNIPFTPVNLGDSINSADPEYFPSLTIDQQTLVFTRNLQNRNEDFFLSHRLGDSTWSKAVNMGSPPNTQYNEGAQNISQDGKILLYAICNAPGGYGSCDIYYAIKSSSGWSQPQNIGAPINTEYWETQPCLSPDNHDLYFVSNRPGGYGGSDLYVSHLTTSGTWSKPENLGPHINSTGNESSPFIHADNQTLFFASDGWPGIGDMDLYYTRKKPDGTWGDPQDLGYPINTIDHEGSLFVAADGKTAYFASDRRDSHGQLDIYRFELYPEARPIQTLYVKGYVYDVKTRQRLSALIDLIDLDSGKTISTLTTDREGNYLVTLPVGKDYAFHVNHEGYLFYSDNFSLKKNDNDSAFQRNIGLQPLEINAHVVLKNIFFDFNQYDLKPASQADLDRLAKLLQDNPTLHIRISGYTDNVGSDKDNLVLSQKRAEAVVQYLTTHGVAAERLTAKGYGESDPVASNDTEAGRAQNRRTEFVITAK